jgi:integrase
MSRGNITKRGMKSWRLKIELSPDEVTGQRRYHTQTVRGSKADAQKELTRVLQSLGEGTYVEPNRLTVAKFLKQWLDHVHTTVAPKTFERYAEIVDKHLIPTLGRHQLQALAPLHIGTALATWLKSGRRIQRAVSSDAPPSPRGLAPRTVKHHHRILSDALVQAVRWQLITRNPATAVEPPRVEEAEIAILDDAQVGDVLRALRAHALYPIVSLALGTGMRRGELLGVRLRDLNLDAATLRIEQSLEQTKAGGLRLKSPKTRNGRRTITLAAATVADLRAFWRKRLEDRVALGLGKPDANALLFGHLDGSPRSPNALTKEWVRACINHGLPRVEFHALRHTHASQLIAGGMDVVSVSRRLGHGSPAITLRVYGHLFRSDDSRAAQIVDAAFAAASE